MRIGEAEFLNFVPDLSELLKWAFQDYKYQKRTQDQMKRKMIKYIFLHALEVSALVFDKEHKFWLVMREPFKLSWRQQTALCQG